MERPVFTPPFTATDLTDADRRDSPRRAVRMRAHLRDRDQTRFDLEMSDLSASGFQAATSFALQPGTAVWLTLPGLAPIEAIVSWRDRFHYGCAFTTPLHPAVHDYLVGLSA